MINGAVNANDEAVIPLEMLDADGRRHQLQAVIDTGFNGYLTLPSALIDPLGLTWQGRTTVTLGDGSPHTLDIYTARVRWDGRTLTVDTTIVDVEPLVGMALLRGYVVQIEVRDGGVVRIEALT